MGYATSKDGTRIHYEEQGNGEPLVLVIGLGGTVDAWKQQVPFFSKDYRVITLDNRGAGLSDAPDEPYSMPIFADDLKAVLDDLGITRTAMLGLSMGGLIVQEFYHRYPHMISRLVLGCTGVGAGDPEYVYPEQDVMDALQPPPEGMDLYQQALRKIEIFYHHEYIARIPGFVEIIMEKMKDSGQAPHAYRRQLEACVLNKESYWNSPRLKNISVPVLVIHGAEDRIWPLQNAQYLADNISDVEFVILPNTAHMLFLEDPNAFNDAVNNFLTRTKK
ncbi:MAG: alpha/beta hydrolase [Spirochaetaceae bacterium]|nr:MAG: alpha/beta hydrolase [Spirochaetaceae bacterium]